MPRQANVVVRPATPESWDDLERLFGPNGAYSNCWCTFWRITRKEFDGAPPAEKRGMMKRLVESGSEPGLLAYRDGEPVAWVALQPREAYPGLDRSRVLKRVDDAPVWAITCFFVHKGHRRTGLMRVLLEAAARHAKEKGARILEGYPTVAGKEGLKGADGYMGLAPAFERAGFVEVARPTARRRVMRRALR